VKKQLSDCKAVLQKRFTSPDILHKAVKKINKAERTIVLELVKSKHKTQEGLGDELYKVIKSTLDEYKWNTVNLVEYKTVLANKLANSRTAIRAQLQEADRHLNVYHHFTTELFSTGQLGKQSLGISGGGVANGVATACFASAGCFWSKEIMHVFSRLAEQNQSVKSS